MAELADDRIVHTREYAGRAHLFDCETASRFDDMRKQPAGETTVSTVCAYCSQIERGEVRSGAALLSSMSPEDLGLSRIGER